MFDWNDLKYFLAVARSGSTLAAARALKVNQTTVARRIDILEKRLGISLFVRLPNGYRLTERGEATVSLAAQVEQGAKTLADTALGWKRAIAGTVRVTTTEVLAIDVLAPLVSELRDRHPSLVVELIADDRRLDLSRGEVDVAIRVGSCPGEPGIVRRRLATSVWALHCARSYADRRGRPQTVEDLNRHDIVGGSGVLAGLAPLVALRKAAPDAPVGIQCNSVPNLIAAVRSGVAVGPLPCWAATKDDDLLRCPIPELEARSDIWLLYHESLRASPHVRLFREAVTARFGAIRHRFEGRGAPRP